MIIYASSAEMILQPHEGFPVAEPIAENALSDYDGNLYSETENYPAKDIPSSSDALGIRLRTKIPLLLL